MFFGSRRDSWRIWLIVGLGLCAYAYYEWSKIHVPTDAELAQIVEIRYQEETRRLQGNTGDGPVELSPEWQKKYRDAIRNEQLAPIEKQKKHVRSVVGGGLLLLVMAGGMFLSGRLEEKQTK